MDEFTNSYLEANEGQNYQTVYNQVLGDKVYTVVKEKINIAEKEVSLDKFRELASAN